MGGGIVSIIQARMGSTRLPGKVLKTLAGRPMISHVVQRVARTPAIDKIVLATTTLDRDQPLVDWARSEGSVSVTRGPEDDVLERYVQAARAHAAECVVRITADCPLIDPEVIQACVELLDDGAVFASTGQQRTFPYGLDVEVMRVEALEAAASEATAPADREHVTPFIWSQPERFAQRVLVAPQNLAEHRWTVDTPEDFELVRRICAALLKDQPHFGYQDVISLLQEHPEWMALNRHVVQKRVER